MPKLYEGIMIGILSMLVKYLKDFIINLYPDSDSDLDNCLKPVKDLGFSCLVRVILPSLILYQEKVWIFG